MAEIFNEGTDSRIDCKLPMLEAIVSVEQIKVLHSCLGSMQSAPKPAKRRETNLMRSVLDFDLLDTAGIEGVDFDED
jgi:hypothetical protein